MRHRNPTPDAGNLSPVLAVLLNDAMALATDAKQLHWNVKGPNFSGLHELFDKIHASAIEYADLLGERLAQFGKPIRPRASDSELRLAASISGDAQQCVVGMTRDLSIFANRLREACVLAEDAHDAATLDILTEILRGTDKWLWMVEAHGKVEGAKFNPSAMNAPNKHHCGGRFRPIQRRCSEHDRCRNAHSAYNGCLIFAHFRCDKCGDVITQKKRQPKNVSFNPKYSVAFKRKPGPGRLHWVDVEAADPAEASRIGQRGMGSLRGWREYGISKRSEPEAPKTTNPADERALARAARLVSENLGSFPIWNRFMSMARDAGKEAVIYNANRDSYYRIERFNGRWLEVRFPEHFSRYQLSDLPRVFGAPHFEIMAVAPAVIGVR